jgi:tRNA (cytosine49-C5)-methyltransferase
MQRYEPKPQYIERIKLLLKDEEDVRLFFETAKTSPKKSIRANTLKISPQKLKERLEKMGWKILQPFPEYPAAMIIDSELQPGELGKAYDHLLGYYYSQEMTSMMPILALAPKPGEFLLDLCAAPGSKTSQAAAFMENKGTIIANDLNIGRISILSANLEKLGITNTIVTRHSGVELCSKFQKIKMKFDKVLVDAPCSGEGNLRTSPNTLLAWSEGLLNNLSKKQKHIASSALGVLNTGEEMIYSTCSYAPEENELVIQYLLDHHDIEILPISLPIKTRPGITEWKGQKLSEELKKCARIYHHDNDMEGFFVCKIKKIS